MATGTARPQAPRARAVTPTASGADHRVRSSTCISRSCVVRPMADRAAGTAAAIMLPATAVRGPATAAAVLLAMVAVVMPRAAAAIPEAEVVGTRVGVAVVGTPVAEAIRVEAAATVVIARATS